MMLPGVRTRTLSSILAVSMMCLASCSNTPMLPNVTPGNTTQSPQAASPAPQASVPSIMPDLVGETVERAESQLALFNVRIKRVSRIAPNAPGLVLTQEPVAGSAFSTSVTLTVSVAPPTVPDVTNTTFGNAQRQLQNLGFEVVEVPVFDDKLVDGVVVKQDPTPGTKNAGLVTLQVARRPAVKYLSDLEPVDKAHYNSFETGTQKSNSISYAHGTYISLYSGVNATIDYDLSRQYRQLVGSVGLNDKASTDSTVKLEVYGDDRLLKEFTLTFGTTTELDVDVTKVLRLQLSISLLRGNAGVVLGDARLQGLPAEVSPSLSPTPTRSAGQ
jgi:hypothetical protein